MIANLCKFKIMEIKIDWVKCHHGVELRNGRCHKCEEEKNKMFQQFKQSESKPPTKIPIYRGCNAKDGCFCSGRCREIIGYRNPLFLGEKL